MTDPPPAGQRRRRRGRPAADPGAQRARFVRIAVQVFTLYGAEASMAQIAAAAGVTKPVLYQYFRDKTDLSRAVGEHSANRLLARVRDVLSDRGGSADVVDRARAVVEVYLDVISGDHDLYQFALYSQLMTIPQAGFTSTFTRALAFLLADELCDGASNPPAQARCHALAGLLHTVCHWWLYHRYPSREALSAGLSRILAAAVTAPTDHGS